MADRPIRTHRLRQTGLLSLLAGYFSVNLSSALEYRASFVAQVLGMIVNDATFIFFWIILFDRIGGEIAGYGFSDVMLLWSLAATGYGIAAVTMGNAPMLSRYIYSGELDVYLLQPKAILPNLVLSRMSIAGFGDFLYGVGLFLLSQELTFAGVAFFVLFSGLAAMLFTALRVFYHSLTFFFGNAEDFAATASETSIAFTTYPGSIFEGPVRVLLHSLVPAGLIAWVPAHLYRSFELSTFLILVAGDLAVCASAVILFRVGLKRYESGNKIGSRT